MFFIALVALLAVPTLPLLHDDAVASRGASAPASAQDALFETWATLLVNSTRAAHGLPQLQRNAKIDAVARNWSITMAARGDLGHNPNWRSELRNQVGAYRSAGENVGWHSSQNVRPPVLHDMFMQSTQGHREAILNRNFTHIGVGISRNANGTFLTLNFYTPAPGTRLLTGESGVTAAGSADAYLAGFDGKIRTQGAARLHGPSNGNEPGDWPLIAPIVGMALTPSGNGYWSVAIDGGVFNFGDARFYGSTGGQQPVHLTVDIAPTPSGRGYWTVTEDGTVHAFGDARNHGSARGLAGTGREIVTITPTSNGGGYWLTGADGTVRNFGNARHHGDVGYLALDEPVVGMSASPDDSGYRLIARDGGVFSLGARFLGSGAGRGLPPVVGVVAAPHGDGYWIFMSNGQTMGFGSVAGGPTAVLDPNGSIAFVVPLG